MEIKKSKKGDYFQKHALVLKENIETMLGVISLLFLLYSYAVPVYGFDCSEYSYNCNAIENHFLEIKCDESGCVCDPDHPDLDICSSEYKTLKEDCGDYCNGNAECQYYKYIEVWKLRYHPPFLKVLCSGSHRSEFLLLDEQHSVHKVRGLLLRGAPLCVTWRGL